MAHSSSRNWRILSTYSYLQGFRRIEWQTASDEHADRRCRRDQRRTSSPLRPPRRPMGSCRLVTVASASYRLLLLVTTHRIVMSGAQRNQTPKRANTSDAAGRPSKRAHTEAAAAAAASSSNATTSALMEGIDPSWSSMYAPLPVALRPESDHTAAAASSSAIATAASSVGGGYIPSLLCGLMPSPAVFESNYNSKLKDKHLMLDNSASAAKGNINLGDAGTKLAKKRRKKRGIQMMSSNQRKEKGMAHIPRDNIKSDESHARPHSAWLCRVRSG